MNYKSVRWMLLLLCGLAAVRAAAQIAPVPFNVVPPGAQQEEPVQKPQPTVMHGANTPAPTAVVTGWSLSSEVDPSTFSKVDASTLQKGSSVTLGQGAPELILFYDAVTHSTQPIEFRYRLNDYDPDWTVTQERIAHYRKLTPGNYKFEVQAHFKGQPWPVAMASLPVIQKPFFYQTWYFYLLLVLGMVALAGQMLSQRDQLLRGQMGIVLEERNRIASDCHDTLMAGFAAISWQLEATAKLFRDAGMDDTAASRSCELARSMVSHCQAEARRIIWDLRDPDEVTNVLSQALSRSITAHRLRDTIDTSFLVEGDEVSIAPGAVHHLVCIGQEAVTNAIRHADATTIQVKLHYDSEELRLSVRDNGHGFQMSNPAPRTGHFGIAVMEERARKLGGAFRLNSSDAGTEVMVTVNFETINRPVNLQQNVIPWIGV